MLIKELFKGCPKTSQSFFNYCVDNGELCELDIEYLEINLFGEITAQNNFVKYLYLNNGTLFDWLEEMGIYVTYKIKMKPAPKFISVVYKSGSNYPIYSNNGVNSREKALFHGFRNGILEIEKNNE